MVSTRPVRPSPVLVARIVGPRDRRDVGDRIGPGAFPLVEDRAISELVRVGHAVEEDDGPRPAVDQHLTHHRHERRIAGPRRDEDVRPLVVGLEHELALRADHPHGVTDRQAPQQRRERPALDEPHVELVAVRARDRRRRGDRVGTLDDLAVDHDPDGHVLAALERRRIAVETDPEVGQGLVLVLAPHERGVVLRRIGIDLPGIGQELGHVRMVPGATSARGAGRRAHIGRMTDVLRRSVPRVRIHERDRSPHADR